VEPTATAIVLAAGGVLLLVAAVASPFSQRLGVPALLLFVLLGMVAGSEGIGGIPFEDYALAFRLGSVALVCILFDAGLNTPLADLRRVALPAGLLATVSVVLTAMVVAAVAAFLGLPTPLALVVGAVVSSTDAAAVFSVLRSGGIRLREPARSILEVESGLNDPMAVILTTLTTEVIIGARAIGLGTLADLATQLGVGALGGLVFGVLGRVLLRSVRLPAGGLYPVLTVAIAFTAFGLTTLVGGSGFLAVYLAAIVLASDRLPYRAGVRRVHDALAWLAQLSMFLMLGLLVFPSRLYSVASTGLLLAGVLALVARPLGVLLPLLLIPLAHRDRVFIAWVGLRGAVPIILATYPVLRGMPHAEQVFDLVFFVTLVSCIIPGGTVVRLARRLGLAEPITPTPPASIELVSLRDYPGEFVWYSVDHASAVAGALLRELPLPEGSVVTLVVRDDQVVIPRGDTRLEDRDHVCVLVTPEDRWLLDLLFGRAED